MAGSLAARLCSQRQSETNLRSKPRHTTRRSRGYRLIVGLQTAVRDDPSDSRTAGHVIIHANPLHGFQLDIDGSDEARLRIESAMTICFAGPIAQKRHNPRSWRKVHGQWDYDTIAELLCAYVALANKLLLSFDGARLLLAIWCKRTGCTLDCSLDSYLNANASTTLISTRFLCLAVE